MFRPFTSEFLYYDQLLIDRPGIFSKSDPAGAETRTLCCSAIGVSKPFHTLIVDKLPDFHLVGDTSCFPFYTYAEDGTHRRENITDWALEQFRSHYADPSITKWDIFHYVYAVLHHHEYRQRYAANPRRELPRIPFVSSRAGALTPKPLARE